MKNCKLQTANCKHLKHFKLVLLLAAFFFNILSLFAQNREHSCGSDELHLKQLKENVLYKQQFDKSNEQWQKYATTHPPKNLHNRSVPLTSPVQLAVAFHNVSTLGLTDAQYNAVITNLNTIFTGTQISFCLAKKYANGDNYLFSAYNHTPIAPTFASDNTGAIGAIASSTLSQNATHFPSTKYINIYIVDDIADTVAGFAYMPSSHGSANDGIYIERAWLLGTTSDDIKILAHEMGHYLGLFHVFGICNPTTIGSLTVSGYNPCSCDNNNCLFDGDMVCDTPPSMLNNVPQTTIPFNTCHTDNTPYPALGITNLNPFLPPIDPIDDKLNYMDYGPQAEKIHFTNGQILRMQFMIDPEYGPRKSLLGIAACTDCSSMNGCSFTIAPSITLPDTRHSILQGTSVNFTTSTTCTAGGLTHTWSLSLLDQVTTPPVFVSEIGATYTLPATLQPGNYQLTLVSGISANCSETTTYNFVVIPQAGTCNLSLPTTNADWTGWDRISFTDGWVRESNVPPYIYIFGTTNATPNIHGPKHNGDFGFDSTGFDILNPTLLNDGNFTSTTPGLPASITQIMRVGRIVNGSNPIPSGTAYYAKKTITITPNNCKYRIWYLGATEAPSAGVIDFPFSKASNPSAFGILSKYEYNSPLSPLPGFNSVEGRDENGVLNINPSLIPNNDSEYLNTLISLRNPNNISNYNASGSIKRMTEWHSIDFDYSEFVNLSPSTNITLTFFSHSNQSNPAFQNSYSYYAIECLGGGIPQDYNIHVPDYNLPCSSPSDLESLEIQLPLPFYCIGTPASSLTNNFLNAEIRKVSSTGVISTNIELGYVPGLARYLLNLTSAQAPFQDYQITVRSLHKTIVQNFRVFIGFYNNIQPTCSDFGTINMPGVVDGDILLCGNSFLPTLTLTDTCIPASWNPSYQWYMQPGDVIIPNATSANLQLIEYHPPSSNFNYSSLICIRNYERHTIYREPYCGNPKKVASQQFHVYNSQNIGLKFVPLIHDTCFGDPINLDINNTRIDVPNCLIPNHLFTPVELAQDNILQLQMCNIDGSISFGNIVNIPTFQGVINGFTTPHNYNFTFNNSPPLFTPTATTSNFNINFKLTGTYLGCPIDKIITGINFQFSPSAIGGEVTLVNHCTTNTIDVNSTINGATFNNQYQWEYSSTLDFSTPITTITGQTGASLTGFNVAPLPLPIYIRRKAIHFSNCPNDAWSNAVFINQNPAPITFTPITLCAGGTLPTESNNHITGTWKYQGNIVTTATVAGNYVFTPTSGQCTNVPTVTVTVTITPSVTAHFSNPTLSLCQSQLPYTLPSMDSNNHAGTWTSTGSTTTITTAATAGTYNFTPTGSCGTAATLTISITPSVTPTFNLASTYCIGTSVPLPSNSTNSTPITGVWHADTATGTIVTSINTVTHGNRTYVFVANGSSTCTNYTYSVTVISNDQTPIFNFYTSLCAGNTPPLLPTSSNNSPPITGTWLPAVINNTASASYTFTPTSGQCANVPRTIAITVWNDCNPILTSTDQVSCENAIEVIGDVNPSAIVDGPCIRVCENKQIVYTLTGGLSNINATNWIVAGGTIVSSNNISCTILWGTNGSGSIQGTVHYLDGSTYIINKCFEILKAPTANFEISPSIPSPIIVCRNTAVNFTNLSTNNGGNNQIYYNWNFGDHNTTSLSTEINPSHTFSQTGFFNVTLLAYNGCSCSSTHEMTIEVIDGEIPIDCPSVVCENDSASYTINSHFIHCTPKLWTVTGGQLINTANDDTQANVIWNHVGASGFGYVSIAIEGCSHCTTTVKVPVVKQVGTIQGNATMCQNSQNHYSLPQWPTTEFNWTLNANGTGATLIPNNQRNEIIVNSQDTGVLNLHCDYRNTLLDCSGSADFTITVNPLVHINGATTVCKNSTNNYTITDTNGNLATTASWNITGPNGYNQLSSGANVSFSPVAIGIYTFNIDTSSNYCIESGTTITVNDIPLAPTTISNSTVAVCPGNTYTYSCVPPAGCTVHWSTSAGVLILGSTVGTTVSVLFNEFTPASSPYIINTWFENDDCASTQLHTTIPRDMPNLTITGDTTTCGSSLRTYSVISSPTTESYFWEIVPASAGSVQTGQNTNSVSILWNQPPSGSTFTGKVKIKERKCRIFYNNNIDVIVYSTPIATITAPSTICESEEINPIINVTPNGTGYTNVTWNYGDGSPEVTSNSIVSPPHRYNSSSTSSNENYTITATVKDSVNGCLGLATATFNITVISKLEISLSTNFHDVNVCGLLPTNTTFIDSFLATLTIVSSFAGTNTVQWYHNNIAIPASDGGNSITFNPVATSFNSLYGLGTFYVIVTNSATGCSSKSKKINIFNDCLTTGGCYLPCLVDINYYSYSCQTFMTHVTLAECPLTNTSWNFHTPTSNYSLISSSSAHFFASVYEPGIYLLDFNYTQNVGTDTCARKISREIIIPYKAGLRFAATCSGSGGYNVTLLNSSTFYSETPVQNCSFSFGGSWYPGTIVSGVFQLSIPGVLPPGTYQVGIKISRPGFAECITYIQMELPNSPSADFTFPVIPAVNCKNMAVPFTALDNTTGLQYHWDFGPPVVNLQKNPVCQFTSEGTKDVTLTVTNRYGCSTSVTKQVHVTNVNLGGLIKANLTNTCIGGTINMNYQTSSGTLAPFSYHWYKNTVTTTPFAVTSVPQLVVTTSGQYFAYVYDSNGCYAFTINADSAVFLPLPETPTIKAPALVCADSNYTVSVPANSGVSYIWSLNGVPQPLWTNNQVPQNQNTVGTYTYQVTPRIQDASGNYCSGTPASFSVHVITLPNDPIINITSIICNPYSVTLAVANPQAGVTYHWSNGTTGTTTTITHDGPLQVQAILNDCMTKSQLELPANLEPLKWIFPNGCYHFCADSAGFSGYIIGPLGIYSWKWQQDGAGIFAGSFSPIDALSGLSEQHDYSLLFATPSCDMTLGTSSVTVENCSECLIKYSVHSINTVSDKKHDCFYSVDLDVTNDYGTDVMVTFTAPNGEGYFMPNTVLVPNGNSHITLYFYPTTGFTGGTISVNMSAMLHGQMCLKADTIDFPPCRSGRSEGKTDPLNVSNSLLLAPNPAHETTTVYYSFANTNTTKTLEVSDLVGRVLVTIPLESAKSSTVLDCTKFAHGTYVLLLKENGVLIKSNKLIVD